MKLVAIMIALVAAIGFAGMQLMPSSNTNTTSSAAPTHTVTRGELLVVVTEQGTLESSNNSEVKCRVRGDNTITFVIDSGTEVQPNDTLLQLETLAIEEEISERTKFFHLAESQVARSAADVARAKLAISEYEQGRYISELASLKKELAVADSRLLNAKNRLKHARMMSRSEYASELEVEEKDFAVSQADLNVKLTQTRIDVLSNFTKKEELVRLQGELKAAEATHKANVERALADKKRLNRAEEELKACTIVAKRAGLVIYPTGEEWKETPEIEEGATVHKNQTLLLMPDLTQMQVKVGIHESMIDIMKTGMQATAKLNRTTMQGEVTYVASVAKPASWWSGNVVKYDTIVSLPEAQGLRPGMSVEVEILVAKHDDVLTLPTTAVIETDNVTDKGSESGFVCWVRDSSGTVRRPIKLGDSNDMFIVVTEGVNEGDEVILDPLASVKEAQDEAARSIQTAKEPISVW